MISIIVPVYKVEKYLAECIDSIIGQTFTDWELLLVDDGSPDNSGNICDEYAAKDKRVKVFHRENHGVSAARNYGLERAVGEWVMFVDSDDVLKQKFISNLFYEVEVNSEVQFVDAGCSLFVGDVSNIVNIKESTAFAGSDPILLWEHFRGPVWAKLFRKDILSENNIFFEPGLKKDEDVIFSLEYIGYVKHYAFSSEVGYLYRQNPKGAMATVNRNYATCYRTYRCQNVAIDKFYKNQSLTPDQCPKGIRMRASCLLWTLEQLNSEVPNRKKRVEIMKRDYTGLDFQALAYYHGRWDNKLLSRILQSRRLWIYDVVLSVILGCRAFMRKLIR